MEKKNDTIEELHRVSDCDSQKIEPKEGQRDSLCSNKESHRCPSLSENIEPLSDEEILALVKLSEILKDIYERNLAEGIINERFEILKPNESTNHSKSNRRKRNP